MCVKDFWRLEIEGSARNGSLMDNLLNPDNIRSLGYSAFRIWRAGDYNVPTEVGVFTAVSLKGDERMNGDSPPGKESPDSRLKAQSS